MSALPSRRRPRPPGDLARHLIVPRSLPFTCTASWIDSSARQRGVVRRPARVEHRFAVAEPFPQLLGDVRRERRDELHERLDLVAVRRALAARAARSCTPSSPRSPCCSCSRGDVLADLLDRLMQLAHRRRDPAQPSVGRRLRDRRPQAVQEAPHAGDPRVAEIAAFLERSEEHQVHAERVGAPLLDVLVGDRRRCPRSSTSSRRRG